MKKCINCGAQLPDDAVFCSECGSGQDKPEETVKAGPQAVPYDSDVIEVSGIVSSDEAGGKKSYNSHDNTTEDPHVSKNVVLCTDGKYRWVYEVNLFKDLSILGLLYKVFGITIGILVVIFFLVELFDGHNYMFVLEMAGILIGIFAVLCIVGYLIYAAVMGGKYCVVFTMDDKGILHEQQAKQAKKANIISDLTVLAGILAGNITTIGIGLTNKGRTSMRTSFKGTKKIVAAPKQNLIKLVFGLEHNRVWCEPEDFNFVWNYIKSRCEGAQITEKF